MRVDLSWAEEELWHNADKSTPRPHAGLVKSAQRFPLRQSSQVHVSPYATEPFPSSVTAVCEAFGLGSGIVKPSRLLSGHEELLDCLIV
jgi:hypothetical protein